MKKTFRFFIAAAAAALMVSCGESSSSTQAPDYEMNYTVSDVTFDMVKVPSGYFTMGLSADNRQKVSGSTIHPVALDGFVITATPVSQALWTAVMGSNPSSVQNPSLPVDMVSWGDVHKFISKLNKATGKTFSLPSEAQWEYAAGLQGKDFVSVAEWTGDSFSELPDTLVVNPPAPGKTDNKIVRTIKDRIELEGHTRKAGVGFRLVQPTGEALPESLLKVLDGSSFDREIVDASDGGSETFTVGDVTFRMVKVKGGEFTMGYSDKDYSFGRFAVPENERNAHQVTLSDFAIGETEVTVGLWKAVMGYVPYLNDAEDSRKPVGNLSWYDCQKFILKLNALTGRTFRLPTEAEWEYAARGGSRTHFYGFSGTNDMNSSMWYVDNANMKAKDVKGKKANELGLHDMSGNVWEWCYDRAADYPKGPQTDPCGPSDGTSRILRGGSCASKWDACRVTNRSFMPARNIKGTFGFRLAM
ncbi:MAG: formylglycine-generating enzyme family protein [Candidatus Cryptobacteroides sp.]